jgi:hypothetical protein
MSAKYYHNRLKYLEDVPKSFLESSERFFEY